MTERYSSLGNSAVSTCVSADAGCSGDWGSLSHLSTPYFLASFSIACCWSSSRTPASWSYSIRADRIQPVPHGSCEVCLEPLSQGSRCCGEGLAVTPRGSLGNVCGGWSQTMNEPRLRTTRWSDHLRKRPQ